MRVSKKAIIRYTLTILFLLVSLWAQSWLLVILLIIHLFVLWHQPTQKRINIWFNKQSKHNQNIYSWILASVYAIIIILFINVYFFGIYTLRSSSMEPTYKTGNVFIMNKVEIGTGKSIDDPDSYHRIRGIDKLDYGEVIVFHFPEADTVFIDHPKENYHYKKRELKLSGKANSMKNSKTEFTPINQRPRFIKRIIAIPGDTLKIIDGNYYINSQLYQYNNLLINKYVLQKNTPKNIQSSILNNAHSAYTEDGKQIIEIQEKVVENHKWTIYLKRQEQPLNMPDPYIFPFSTSSLWNASFWGPSVIPAKGTTIEINEDNIALYIRIIETYEGNKIKLRGRDIYINGKICHHYTFKMNYYWVAGDNRPHSFDSRYWGFVPENHIIGVINKLPFTK
nr:signal peptidase I [uncultured Carboxylicivirga sp.]